MASGKFEIIPLDVGAGQVALCPMPGRFGHYGDDLSTIMRWGPDLVLTMTPQTELDRVGAGGLGTDLAAIEIEWWHLPIVDFGAPDSQITARWDEVSTRAIRTIGEGGKVLCHCFGGCGRSGMAALRIMIDAGERPYDALQRLRSVRPCAVETDAQFAWAASGA